MVAFTAATAAASALGGSSFLSGLGSVAGGLGSLAGGLGIGRKKEKRWSNTQYGYKVLGKGVTRRLMRKGQITGSASIDALGNQIQFDGLMKSADKHGLHPLSVIGSGQQYNAPASYVGGNDYGVDLQAMGQGVDRAVNAGRDKIQRQLDELALEKAQLSNDYLRTQIAGSQKALLSTSNVPSVGMVNSSGVPGSTSDRISNVASTSVSHKKGNAGLEAAASPMWKKFNLDNDTSIYLPPNQSVDELGYPMSIIKSAELAYKNFHKKTPGYYLSKYFKNRPKKKRKHVVYKSYKYGTRY